MGNSLVQGSSQQNQQEVMDSKEIWNPNLLGLVAKRRGHLDGRGRGSAQGRSRVRKGLQRPEALPLGPAAQDTPFPGGAPQLRLFRQE